MNSSSYQSHGVLQMIMNPLLLPWLYLYRARNKVTQLLTPTHAQLQRHTLKFIKKPFKNSC